MYNTNKKLKELFSINNINKILKLKSAMNLQYFLLVALSTKQILLQNLIR